MLRTIGSTAAVLVAMALLTTRRRGGAVPVPQDRGDGGRRPRHLRGARARRPGRPAEHPLRRPGRGARRRPRALRGRGEELPRSRAGRVVPGGRGAVGARARPDHPASRRGHRRAGFPADHVSRSLGRGRLSSLGRAHHRGRPAADGRDARRPDDLRHRADPHHLGPPPARSPSTRSGRAGSSSTTTTTSASSSRSGSAWSRPDQRSPSRWCSTSAASPCPSRCCPRRRRRALSPPPRAAHVPMLLERTSDRSDGDPSASGRSPCRTGADPHPQRCS